MDLLLDSHVFLWWDSGDPQLNAAARSAISDPRNRVFISAGVVWEIAIKRAKGKLAFSGSLSAAIGANRFMPLSITTTHTESAGNLAWTHRDPFDRLFVAQALSENMTLIHGDANIAAFSGLAQLWAK
jgi:PIN domain nuclease of toxin-antitoxin system